MFISKKKAKREREQATDALKMYYEYALEAKDNQINALQEALDGLTVGIEEERTCDGCKHLGKPNTCKYCNRKAPDRWEVKE